MFHDLYGAIFATEDVMVLGNVYCDFFDFVDPMDPNNLVVPMVPPRPGEPDATPADPWDTYVQKPRRGVHSSGYLNPADKFDWNK